MQQLGKGKLIISDRHYQVGKGPREGMFGKRFDALQPIYQATDYLTGIEWQETPQGVTHDIGAFRFCPWHAGESLAHWQARSVEVELPQPPPIWLDVKAEHHHKIVVHRTARYQSPAFPWHLIIDKYHADIIFLGLPQEYADFQLKAGNRRIEYAPTVNLLQAAKIIKGSRLFIGNQSVMFWIAAGLGHPLIQETHHQYYSRDSIIPRDNAMFIQSKADLIAVLKHLDLDTTWGKEFDFITEAPKFNLSTSAGQPRRNLSTSAELFEN